MPIPIPLISLRASIGSYRERWRTLRTTGLDQLQINILSGPAMRSVSVGVVLVSYPIYLRYLGFNRYGLWLVLSTVLMVSQLGNLGIVQAVAKVVAEEYARRDILAIRQYTTTAVAALLGTGLAALTAVFCFRAQIAALLGLQGSNLTVATNLLPYCAILSVYVFVADVQTNVLAGLGRIDLVNYLQVASQVVGLGIGLILLHRGGGVESLLAASMASKLFQHLLSALLVWRILDAPLFSLTLISWLRLRHLAQFCGGLFASTIVNLLLTPFNRLVIARYVGIEAVPVYEIAFNGTMQIRSLLAAGSSALVPEISRLSAAMTEKSREEILRLNRGVSRLLLGVGIPLYCFIFLTIDRLLRLWLHSNVGRGQSAAFHIMLVGSFLSLLGTVPYNSLLGLHKSRNVLYSFLAQSTVNVVFIGGAILWRPGLSLLTVLLGTSLGMGASTLYLYLANKHATQALQGSSIRKVRSQPIDQELEVVLLATEQNGWKSQD